MSGRLEFSRTTRRDALRRAGMLCEATGKRYGLAEGHRCNASLGNGVEFDHFIPWEFSRDSSLDNCRAICKVCHKYTTANDIRDVRKSDRRRDKDQGVMKPSSRPMLGSRASGWKRKINGTVERRT